MLFTLPPDRNINHPEFVRQLREAHPGSLALALACPQIFSEELLGVFDVAINLHGGCVPAYRGWGATAWSMYRGEATSGFAFHYMMPGVDEGSVLHEEAVPIGTQDLGVLLAEKLRLQLASLEQVILDGIWVKAVRFRGLPYFLWKASR